MLIPGITVLRLKVARGGTANSMTLAVHTGGYANAQVEVMTLRGDGNVAIGLDTASEKLEVDGTVKCADLKFDDVDGATTNLSSVISDLLLRVAELEDRFGIDITTGVNDTLVFQHYYHVDSQSQRDHVYVHNRPGRPTVHNRRNANGNKRGDCDAGKCSERDHNDHGVQW